MKSSLVEEAANELINMLLEFDHNQREEVEKFEEGSCTESKTIDHNDSEGMLTVSFHDQTQYSVIIMIQCCKRQVKKGSSKVFKGKGITFFKTLLFLLLL